MQNKVFLCAICNINSGTCNEDCKFCTQSVKYSADIERYKEKPIEQILSEAKAARQNGALGFCLVTARKGLDDKGVEFVSRTAHAISKAVPELRLIACNGTASREQLRALKQAGVKAYNHNLETAESFYANICTTHPWQERYMTCEAVNAEGLVLISGGIYGLGETQAQRLSMLEALRALNPTSVPINFFHPNNALPITSNPLTTDEALALIALTRQNLPHAKRIMVAGGRELQFKTRQAEIFKAGANAIVIGDYLTTKGRESNQDLAMLASLGLDIATSV